MHEIFVSAIFEPELTRFFEKHRLFTYRKGETIYRPGDLISHVAFVKSGYIKLYNIDAEGQEITVNLFKPLFFLTLLYAQNDLESRFYFEAVTPVEVWRAPKEEVFDFLKKNPEILANINNGILNVLEETIFNSGNLIFGNSYRKTAAIILSLAKQFGETVEKNKVRVNFTTTQEVLSSLTGLTRETVCLQATKLKDLGIIGMEGKFFIIEDMEALKKISSLD